MKRVEEEVLNCHFGEMELLVVLGRLMGGKYFDNIFGLIGPLPVGVRQRSSRGQIFKLLQMYLYGYQITP